MKRCWLLFFSFFSTISALTPVPVVKKVLDNGLVVLVRPTKTAQKVSVQLWYNVGSKDEATGEKGLAHLLEHMVFKGTKKMSETDIDRFTNRLAGFCNASTNADYTNYHFELPVQHWHEALPVLADCMANCTFKTDLLNAEFKVVIQELKMYRDNATRSLYDKMMTALFADHPYHYPVIGYKQDLWRVTSKKLHDFYKKHYLPNNAVLVVVGNVDPSDVFKRAQSCFGHLKGQKNYRKETFYCNEDLATQNVILHRDVKNPEVVLSYVIPGTQTRDLYALDVLLYALCSGKSSLLNKKIVEERQLANYLQVFTVDHFEHDLLLVRFEPQKLEYVKDIIDIVHEEFDRIARDGFSEQELRCAAAHIMSDFYLMVENNHELGRYLGRGYLATGDEQCINHYFVDDLASLNASIQGFVGRYCAPWRMHQGMILPFSGPAREEWQRLQELSDVEDAKFLSERTRKSEVEPVRYAAAIKPQSPSLGAVDQLNSLYLSNGLQVVLHPNDAIPKIELVISLKATAAYDPEDCQGLYSILCSMMLEGTNRYPGLLFAKELDDHAISLKVTPGFIRMSMLSSEFEKGLELLGEVVSNAIFEKKVLEKVKKIALFAYQRFFDSPQAVARKIARDVVYQGHPYSKFINPEAMKSITCAALYNAYSAFITPKGARLVVVGDLSGVPNARELLEKYLGAWQGPQVDDLAFPSLQPVASRCITRAMDRDQVVLVYAGLSVPRCHPDFFKLSLFEQILSGGMNSRLFKLRQRYGIFYTAQGSLVSSADEQPGMVTLYTIVSKDRLSEAEQLFDKVIDTVVDSITPQEIEEAKNVLLNNATDFFATNAATAETLHFLYRYNFPLDYFVRLPAQLAAISVDEVKVAVKKVFNRRSMVVVKVGRV